MPRISAFYGIVIEMYFDDHPPPHFHALYAGEEALIVIDSGEIYAGVATHDYKRHGTSSLYAALDLATGKVIGSLHQRHRAIEFHKFLQRIDREVPAHLDVHLVLDNSSTRKTPKIKRWLAQHPRSYCTSPRPAAAGSTSSSAGSAN